MFVFELLAWSLYSALASVALTVIVRNAPVIRGLVARAKKPWACNVCMPLYTNAVVAAGVVLVMGDWRLAAASLPGYILANIGLDKMSRPPAGGPPPLLPLDSGDEDEDDLVD